MELWVSVNKNGKSYERMISPKIKSVTSNVNHTIFSRAVLSLNALRNAELEVLSGKRSGRIYKKPNVKKRYQTSAAGEPPASRTGALRLHWSGTVQQTASTSNGVRIIAEIESNSPYAGYLDKGTSKMAPRPFSKRIRDKAEPEVRQIFGTPYL